MDRKKAIEVLQALLDCNYVGNLSGEDREALNMALASLKTDEAYNLLYEETTKKDLEVEADDCTNGDMIKSLFPNAEINYGLNGIVGVKFIHMTVFDLDWWNAPFKRGKTDD